MSREFDKRRKREKPSKYQCILNNSFEKKLAWYAAAGSALLALTLTLPMTAKADITYSGPVDQVVSGPSGSLFFSLDNTGADFQLSTNVYNNGVPGGYGAYAQLFNETSGSGLASPIPVSGGDNIGPLSNFQGGVTLTDQYVYYTQQYNYYSCGLFRTCYYISYNSHYVSSGLLPNDLSPNYVGLEFSRSGQTYYGWAEIGVYVTDTSAQAELFDYAYNTTPDAPIQAGEQMSPTPEPPTMALYALGAIGVLAVMARRRKSILQTP